MPAALGPSGNFVFVRDAVVPDDQSPSEQVDHQGPHRKRRGRMQDVDRDDQHAQTDSHYGETYCQRPNHVASLAKHGVENENCAAEDDSDRETCRRHPLNPLGWGSPENGESPKGTRDESGRDDHRPDRPRDNLDENSGNRWGPTHAMTVETAAALVVRKVSRRSHFSKTTRALAGRTALRGPAPRRR